MRYLKSIVTLALTLLVFSTASPISAQNEAGLSFDVEEGFDGFVKNNAWSPIRITASNVGPDAQGEIRLKTQYPGETYARELSLPSQSQKEVALYLPLTSVDFTLEFVSEGRTLYRENHTPRTIPPDSFLIGVVASDLSLLNFLAGLQTTTGLPISVAHLSLDELPEITQGLSALDVLIFNDIDTTPLTEAQRTNLADWVMSGGRLVMGGGPNGAATVSGLRPLLPATELTSTTLSALPGLEGFANESVPNQGPYLAAVPRSIRGQIDIAQENDALLISNQVGAGRVMYFALDFGLAPMNGWAGNDAFWGTVLDPIEAQTPFYASYEGVSNLNNALANIDVAVLPSPVMLMLFLCAYILILVPANYLILAYFKRRELAWVTIPALIIMFSLAGYIGGFRARGGQALLRQISVIQQPDISDDRLLDVPANVDTFIGLYSPNRGQYTLKFDENLLVKPTDSGSGYSGVKDTSSAPTTILFGGQTELQNLWTDVGTMATAVAHGQTAPQSISLNLEVSEQNGQWHISGIIQNNSNENLEDAVLVVGDRGVQISQLGTGETTIDHTLRQLDVVNNYSDTTIWGEYYYQVNDAKTAVNDQIIRSIFWPDYGYQPQQSLFPKDKPESIILYGWQTDAPSSADIEVVGSSVDREAVNLLIIRKTL